MPVILLDRLPLPSLKAYTIISVVLLSCSVYYAVQVTNDPNWKVNSTNANLDTTESEQNENLLPNPPDFNENVSVGYHLGQLMTFMIQEPLCIWFQRKYEGG
ncbi:hypothetical protein L9F63_001632, partial [Diploptera punctata]